MVDSSEPKGYQGWKNYETWAVHLWISNEQGSHEEYDGAAEELYEEAVRAQLREFVAGGGDKPAEHIDRDAATEEAARELADRMKRDLDDEAELPKAVDGTVYADLLNAALQEVDWFEVAEAYVENCGRGDIDAEIAAEFAADPGDEDDAAD